MLSPEESEHFPAFPDYAVYYTTLQNFNDEGRAAYIKWAHAKLSKEALERIHSKKDAFLKSWKYPTPPGEAVDRRREADAPRPSSAPHRHSHPPRRHSHESSGLATLHSRSFKDSNTTPHRTSSAPTKPLHPPPGSAAAGLSLGKPAYEPSPRVLRLSNSSLRHPSHEMWDSDSSSGEGTTAASTRRLWKGVGGRQQHRFQELSSDDSAWSTDDEV